jgi:hypothetical protein
MLKRERGKEGGKKGKERRERERSKTLAEVAIDGVPG